MQESRLVVSFGDLRGAVPDPVFRVGVAAYSIPRATNPNGLPRPSRIVSTCSLTVGRDFRLHARIIRQGEGMALELSPAAFDMARQEPCSLLLTPGLARACYNQMAAAHVAAQARQHAQSKGGRN